MPSSQQKYFEAIELGSVVIFTVEYAIRLACQPCNLKILRFVAKPQNVVDLLACLPYWVTKAMSATNEGSSGKGGLGFIRVVRLVRVFRVFKFGKYSSGIQMFGGAISRSIQPLSILLFTITLAVIIIGSIIYLLEGDISDVNASNYKPELLFHSGVVAETHLFCFGTIPRTFWWAIVTMTTVGYGDCYPITLPGKLLAMVTM